MNDQIAVYTCVTGGFDQIARITSSDPLRLPGCRYIVYTDTVGQRSTHNGWELRPVEWSHPTSQRRTSRWHKINSHRLFSEKFTIWFDGSQEFVSGTDPRKMLDVCGMATDRTDRQVLASFKHPQRTCIYQELEACEKLHKDDPQLMHHQVEGYRAQGYPPYNGLVETACVLRENCGVVRTFNDLWWKELQRGSLRDQLSFNYVAWRLELDYGHLPGSRGRSNYFIFHPHK